MRKPYNPCIYWAQRLEANFFMLQKRYTFASSNVEQNTFFMTHKFVVNTENVNSYGYRVLTDGIDYAQYLKNPIVLFMHTREDYKNRGGEVIGKCVKLYVENKELIAEIEFDVNDDFAKKIADKVQRGFLRMASLYATIIETSTAPEHVLPGQTLETVVKCKLIEISIVDIGGNDDALRLSHGNEVSLKQLNQKKESMSKLVTIALALGMMAEATEDAVLKEVQELKLAKQKSDEKASALEVQLNAIVDAEGTALVDKLVSLSLLPESLKAVTLAAYKADPAAQKVVLSKLITDKEAEDTQNTTHKGVKEVVLGANKQKPGTADDEQSFDYLQKHNVVELSRIRTEEPEKYAKLAQEYEAGKRYTAK